MITVTVNGADLTSKIAFPSLAVQQNLTNEVDTASFDVRSTLDRLKKEDGSLLLQESGGAILLSAPPAFDDDVVISDGGSVVFAGKVARVEQAFENPRGAVYRISCIDHTFEMDRLLVARSYENETVAGIIDDLIASYAPGFTTANVSSDFTVAKIVFNNIPLSQCLRRLADLVRYDWYVDEDKDVHFFPMFTNAAPFSLTDTAGKHVYMSLVRTADGSQVVNRVKVRGGEYDGATYTDTITVAGSDTKSFVLPYKMSDLAVEVDTGAGFVTKTVGVDFIDTFADFDVLYNFQTQSFRFASPLAAGNKVRYSGSPKTPVTAVMEHSSSVARYGPIEKFIRDTSILSNAIARKRAAAELLAYSDVAVDARFKTYTPGLRAGMLINVQPGGLEDALLIKRITFAARTPADFDYDVTCISTQRYTLLDVLRKILAPEPQQTDEREVSETLVPVSEEIELAQSVRANTPTTPLAILNQQSFHTTDVLTSTTFDCTGANMLVVAIGFVNNGTLLGMTYNGVALTQDVAGTASGLRFAIFRLLNPASGTNTLSLSFSGNPKASICMAYAVSGINTASAVAGTASDNPAVLHQELSVAQPNNVLSIGFMVAGLADTAGTRSWTPDTGCEEDFDSDDGSGTLSNRVTFLHRIFSRAGTNKIGTTYNDATVDTWLADAMALYNGFDPSA